ncbi:MAG: hypothetical protein QNJ04_17025 [Desulfobacterales bacterium]|nr:hypothetical protein [Desulfobacterales bacterium]
MKSQPRSTISLKLDKARVSPFLVLLQSGFVVEVPSGLTIKKLLCGNLKVDEDYLEGRIQTIFLDGKPVDDVDTALVNHGSVLALSAAMPGLVGSTFRRDGVLAAFRSSITYQQEETVANGHQGVAVWIKLFNLLVNEMGPQFLEKGIIVNREEIRLAFEDGSPVLLPVTRSVELDGKEIPYEQLNTLNWSQLSENLHLTVWVSPQGDAH